VQKKLPLVKVNSQKRFGPHEAFALMTFCKHDCPAAATLHVPGEVTQTPMMQLLKSVFVVTEHDSPSTL
jgi:hypothetical protein